MNWFSGILVYAVVWWLVFFMILPIGVVTQDESGEEQVKGSVSSAPSKPRLRKKVLWAALVTAVVWVIIEIIISSGAITLRPPVAT